MKNDSVYQYHRFDTPHGTIFGFEDGKVIRAKGIRYANSERFQYPTPVESLKEPFYATQTCPVCPQTIDPFLERMIGKVNSDDYTVNESCQFLSITLPKNFDKSKKIPVMVWIHGGSYILGSGDLPTSDPKFLVQEQNVMVVSINYRLGLFGFLGNDQRPANLGLLDIIEGLKWIKKNISGFGGDENNITLFGQSAGGDAIAHLMISEGAENLFHKAIIQSAPLHFRHRRENLVKEFNDFVGEISMNHSWEDLVDLQDRFKPNLKKYGLKAFMPFGTQYGKFPLPEESQVAKKWREVSKKYDVLIGINDAETTFYIPTSENNYRYLKMPFIGSLLKRTLIRFLTETIYGNPAKKFAKNYAKGGGKVLQYRIFWGNSSNKMDATHAIDLALLFGDKKSWKDSFIVEDIDFNEILSSGKKIRKIWGGFAKNYIDPTNTVQIKIY